MTFWHRSDVRARGVYILTAALILVDIVILNSFILSTVTFQFITNTSLTLNVNNRLDLEDDANGSSDDVIMQNTTLTRIFAMITDIIESDRPADDIIYPTNKHVNRCPTFPRLKQGVEDLLCLTPPHFLPMYKNPCWFTMRMKFRCLPYFQIIGIDKSGTTDLFDKIAKHPDVLRNEGKLQKETMWWSWLRYGHWLKEDKEIQSFRRYLQYFTKASYVIKSQIGSRLITADATPMDFWDMSGWDDIPQNAGLTEPAFLTPHLIHHMNPHVKLILILRDPVERLLSDYFFLKQGEMTVKGFHSEVVNAIIKLHMCTRQNSLRGCLYDRELHVGLNARIHLGFYSIFMKDWLNVFPREQFYIITTEMYSENPSLILKQVYDFLDLESLSEEELDQFATSERQYVTKNKANKMLKETRAILDQLYEPFVHELADILEDEIFLWKKDL